MKRGQLDAQRLAQDLDLELQVQLQVVLLVQLGQQVHDAHGPGGGRFEDLALGAGLEDLGNERYDVEEFLLPDLVRFYDQRLDIQIYLLRRNEEKERL